jgi:hypothetical protein
MLGVQCKKNSWKHRHHVSLRDMDDKEQEDDDDSIIPEDNLLVLLAMELVSLGKGGMYAYVVAS